MSIVLKGDGWVPQGLAYPPTIAVYTASNMSWFNSSTKIIIISKWEWGVINLLAKLHAPLHFSHHYNTFIGLSWQALHVTSQREALVSLSAKISEAVAWWEGVLIILHVYHVCFVTIYPMYGANIMPRGCKLKGWCYRHYACVLHCSWIVTFRQNYKSGVMVGGMHKVRKQWRCTLGALLPVPRNYNYKLQVHHSGNT